MRIDRPNLIVVLGLLVVMVGTTLPAGGQAADTLVVEKADQDLSPIDIVVAISQASPAPPSDRIVIARDDAFADALASGVLQSDARLLLVPSTGPIPATVEAEIQRLAPTRADILGGTAAIGADVESQLQQLGLTTTRRAGPDRIATAIEIARVGAPTATTAMLVRAFGEAGNATAGFADTLGAGGVAASNGWPILLTDSATLSGATREYLQSSAITEVLVVGGTAAVSAQVAQEVSAMGLAVERVSGPTRFETATALADAGKGAASAADVDHVVLADGVSDDAWAAGFASASIAAALDGVVVLGTPDDLPAATTAWLSGSARRAGPVWRGQGIPRLTCVNVAGICEEARMALGLPPASPPPQGTLVTGACDGFRGATLSGDGTTVAYVATQGCPNGPASADAASLVFIDVAGGAVTAWPLPFEPTCGGAHVAGVALGTDGRTAVVEGFPLCETPPLQLTRDALVVGRLSGAVQSVRGQCGGGSWAGFSSAGLGNDSLVFHVTSADATACGVGGAYNVLAAGFTTTRDLCGDFRAQFSDGVCTNAYPTTTDGSQVGIGGNDGQGRPLAMVLDPSTGGGSFAQAAHGGYTFCSARGVSDDGTLAALLCASTTEVAGVVVTMASGADVTLDMGLVGMTPDGRYVVGVADGQVVIADPATGAVAAGPAGAHPTLSDDATVLLHTSPDADALMLVSAPTLP